MRDRLQQEHQDNPQPRPTPAAPASSGNGDRMVSPEEMKSLFPDLFPEGG